MTVEELGAFVRKERKKRRWSIMTLGKKAGVNGRHLGFIELGKSKIGPSLCVCSQLLDALGYELAIVPKETKNTRMDVAISRADD